MAKYTGPSCKICRREGMPLLLKGQRCLTEKCSIKKKKYPPGPQKKRRTKLSEYGIQLREKQKIRKTYGVLEKQFRLVFQEANRMKGVTGENMLSLLERRLDNVIYRMGLASSRNMARQLVQHGHILVNGKRVDIASYRVKEGSAISLDDKFLENVTVTEAIKLSKAISSKPEWLDVDYDNKKGSVTRLPKRDDIKMSFNEQLVVELYSK
ncbi:MAG: 30S ribosomal protein S4 [Spirochaetes bacterium]|jgi:small subunit ribosomal protein S4|nr:30S ribosomal protein S4 [Spirochaetota bacterium]